MVVKVSVQRLQHSEGIDLPSYETAHSAGMDLPAAIVNEIVLAPGARATIPTGIAVALPDGYEAQIRPRSGLAARDGVSVLNAPGTVDADYRGEIKVILINFGGEPFRVSRGMRIAQMIIAPVTRIAWEEMESLPDTARGAGGFGSTGSGRRS